jgi:hypothetical protein
MEEFVRTLKAGAGSREDVFVEMARARYRRQSRINRLGDEIGKKSAMSADIEASASIDAYRAMINVDQKGVLAEIRAAT